jgi:hypothetical protein
LVFFFFGCFLFFLSSLFSLLLELFLEISLLLFQSSLIFHVLLDLCRFCSLLFSWDLLLFLWLFYTVCKFLELGNEETVHIVHMRVDPASEFERRMEPQMLMLGEAGLAHLWDTCLDKFNVASSQRIVDNPFVLFDWNRASRVPIF